ncbi:MAG: hypothetical protein ABIW38_15150 [Ferruginibacter sp.]
MYKQNSTLLFAAVLGIFLLSSVIFTGCNDEKKESTMETTVTDTTTMPMMDTTHMDTANTRPIMPGS